MNAHFNSPNAYGLFLRIYPRRRFHSLITRSFTLAISLIFIFVTEFGGLAPSRSVHAAPEIWKNVSRRGNDYRVYQIKNTLGEVTGVFATDLQDHRVSDTMLEQLLVYDAATLEVPSATITSSLPGWFEASPNGAFFTPESWGHPTWVGTANPPRFLYTPYFYNYADYSNFVLNSIYGSGSQVGCWIPIICLGLENPNHAADVNADVLLAIILQSGLSEDAAVGRQAAILKELAALKEQLEGQQDAVAIIDLMMDTADLGVVASEQASNINAVFASAAGRTIGYASAGLSAIGVGLSGIQAGFSISAHNLRAAMEYQYAVQDMDQRLQDLKRLYCGGSHCSLTSTNALIAGLGRAEDRFIQMANHQDDQWVEKLRDPQVANDIVELIGSVAGMIIDLVGLSGTLVAGPVLMAANVIVLIVVYEVQRNIASQTGLDELRRVGLYYELFRNLRGSLPQLDPDRRYYLSLLNMAYYALYSYFDVIDKRVAFGFEYTNPDPAFGWMFERPGTNCYIQTDGACTRDRVRQEVRSGRAVAQAGYYFTLYGGYLSLFNRAAWRDKILPYDYNIQDSLPVLSNPSIAPTNSGDTGTNFTFSVTYTDEDNNPPSSVSVIVDSTTYALSSSDTTYSNGSNYTSTPRTFSTGVHTYRFQAVQGGNSISTNPMNFYVTQSAAGHNLTLTTLELSRTSAQPGDSVSITGQINNNGIYTENNIVATVNVTGPGGYTWSYSKSIGTLAAGGIWGNGLITNWNAPSGDGDYSIQVIVSAPAGDENLSDNIKTRSIFVSSSEPLEYRSFRYRFYQLAWDWTPDLPAPYNNWGAYGPASITCNGKTYQVWATDSGSEWMFYIKDTSGNIYLEFLDEEFVAERTYYVDNETFMFGADTDNMRYEQYLWVKLGYPEPSSTITPEVQSVPMGTRGSYTVHLPCSGCSYPSAEVYRASNGDDPPDEFFYERWSDYSISGSAPNFTLSLGPRRADDDNFAFDTNTESLSVQNYIIFGKVVGYIPVDNPPAVSITSPLNGITVSGTLPVYATATDDNGVNRVEFYIDGALAASDSVSPYQLSWNSTGAADGLHTLQASAFDTAGQTSSQSIQVTVDNQPPTVSGVSHTPAAPTNLQPILIQATISDVSGIAAATLSYSADGGSTWSQLAMNSGGGNLRQATVPAHNAGTLRYRIQATDLLGRTATSSEFPIAITDVSPPTFIGWIQSPTDLNEDSSGPFRITVTLSDLGGSGLSGRTPQADFKFGSDNYTGYQNMTLLAGNTWYFEVPAQDWNARRGQTLYYRTQVSDIAGNLGTSGERYEPIESINDAPRITSHLPLNLTPNIAAGDCMNFSISAIDEDEDSISHTWLLDNQVVSASVDWSYCPQEANSGQHILIGLITDGRASDSIDWIITVPANQPPAAFNKSGPANGATGQPLSLTLHWQATAPITRYEYCYDDTNDNACSGWTSTGTATQATISGLSYGRTYYWQVQAWNGASGPTGAAGGYWRFTTILESQVPPAAFNKSGPADGSLSQPLSLMLTWQPTTPRTRYEYCFDTTNDNACSGWVSTGTATQRVISGLNYSTTYYWQARAWNGTVGPTYASGGYWRFTTALPCSAPSIPGGGAIVFQSDRDGDYEIYRMTGSECSVQNLTNNSTDDFTPAWSPDGRRIVYHSGGDVYIMDADGGNKTYLSWSNATAEPAWSPDGSQIVYQASVSNSAQLMLINANGTNLRQLTDTYNYDNYGPAWSPDGTQIVFTSRRPAGTGIWLMNADGSNQHALLLGMNGYPAWSPDGTKIAFQTSRHGNAEIYVMNADGTGEIRLTNNTAIDSNPKWSPDGGYLLFTSNRSGNNEIYAMRADGTDLVRLTNNTSRDDWGIWRPGTPAAFSRLSPANNALRQPLTVTLTWQSATRATRYEYCIDTTNDGACNNWASVGTATQVTVRDLDYSTQYFWQVRAWNDDIGPTAASGPMWTFWTDSLVPGSPFAQFVPYVIR